MSHAAQRYALWRASSRLLCLQDSSGLLKLQWHPAHVGPVWIHGRFQRHWGTLLTQHCAFHDCSFEGGDQSGGHGKLECAADGALSASTTASDSDLDVVPSFHQCCRRSLSLSPSRCRLSSLTLTLPSLPLSPFPRCPPVHLNATGCPKSLFDQRGGLASPNRSVATRRGPAARDRAHSRSAVLCFVFSLLPSLSFPFSHARAPSSTLTLSKQSAQSNLKLRQNTNTSMTEQKAKQARRLYNMERKSGEVSTLA